MTMNNDNEMARVISVNWHAPGIFELALERDDIRFMPGDCTALFGADNQASRPYSFASGVDETALRFLIRRMEGGEVSPYLAERQPGDRVRISPPFGWFRPGQSGEGAPSVFIATGTGIAPFFSYLRTWPDSPPLRVLYGVRQRADAIDLEWLRERCDVRLAVSREDAEDAFRGRVTDLLPDVPLGPEIHYYLCGLDAMIDQTTVWLEERGIDIAHIHRECFFNAES